MWAEIAVWRGDPAATVRAGRLPALQGKAGRLPALRDGRHGRYERAGRHGPYDSMGFAGRMWYCVFGGV